MVPELKQHMDQPFAFFGHSMGALLGFELARHLRRECGLSPSHLFVSGRRAPQLERARPPIYDLPQKELLRELKCLNGTPREALEHPELMELMLPLLRADFAVCDTYEYREGPLLDCSITALGGLLDADVTPQSLDGWREQTTASFSLHMLPGDHFFLQQDESQLLSIIAKDLNQYAR